MIPRLHILTDTVLQKRWSHVDLSRMAWEGNADCVQYREKLFSEERKLADLKEILELVHSKEQKLIVNDSPGLAKISGADGVHLGLEDPAIEEARALLGPTSLIGATIHSLEELQGLEGEIIDYIGVGPVFGTKSKNTGLQALGLKNFSEICNRSKWPVIAIGSVNLENVKEVIGAGAWGIALISAFCLSENPIEVAKKIRDILE